jgi:hypothetical protein
MAYPLQERLAGGEIRVEGNGQMSRSGYSEDFDASDIAMWRGQVASAIRGKRGQVFFRDLVAALDALSDKRLIAGILQTSPTDELSPTENYTPNFCAIGSVGLARGLDMSDLDPDNTQRIADIFNIAHQLAAEIVFENDEAGPCKETPEARWHRMRAWAVSKLKGKPDA